MTPNGTESEVDVEVETDVEVDAEAEVYKGLTDCYNVECTRDQNPDGFVTPQEVTALMNYNIFDRLVASVYRQEDTWPLESYIHVFHKFFDEYDATFAEPHPHISRANIRKLMDEMPWLTLAERGVSEPLNLDSYDAMIERYFEIDWENCDYNINHFFSGQIRELRFYETCY